MVLSVACIMRSRKLPGSTPRRGAALGCPGPPLPASLAVPRLASPACALAERSDSSRAVVQEDAEACFAPHAAALGQP